MFCLLEINFKKQRIVLFFSKGHKKVKGKKDAFIRMKAAFYCVFLKMFKIIREKIKNKTARQKRFKKKLSLNIDTYT